MIVLVTGGRGMLGRSLVGALRKGGHSVLSAIRRGPPNDNEVFCDLEDRVAVENLVSSVRPDRIFHLAGSFANDLNDDLRGNVVPAGNLAAAVAQHAPAARIVLSGSAAEYGMVPPSANPVTEDRPANPVSIYGLTKLYQTQLGLFWARTRGLDIVIARIFNLLGEGASERLFIGRVERQIAACRASRADRIVVGNLDSVRDYMPVERAAKDLMLLADAGAQGEIYNVGSGVPVRIGELLDRLLAEAGMSGVPVDRTAADQQGRADVPVIYADIRKLEALRAARHKPTRGDA